MTHSSGDRNPVEELAEEFIARRRRGEKPSLSDYTEQYPELAADIRELFPALVMMEDLGDAPLDSTGPHTASLPALKQLGDYRILREVGRGGMGVVYEAEQQSLSRRVALKVLPPHALNDEQQVRRFEREAKAAARLHHTNIVPVYGVGHEGGTHYYVMQFIAGLGLDGVLEELRQLRTGRLSQKQAAGANGGPPPDWSGPTTGLRPTVAAAAPRPAVQQAALSLLTGSFRAPPPSDHGAAAGTTVTGGPSAVTLPRLPDGSDLSSVSGTGRRYWRSVARIGVQVADALEYAHGQGILHRDVKPSNLLMDARGTVWVTDFGLAKGGDAEELTHTGDIVGTVRYMAPERFQGQSDARSDVYSLGLTLYELAALQPAFLERDRARLIQQVMHEEPPPLRKVNPAVPRDLETIVHKALAKEPGRRYARAADLAEDLQRFLDDRPIRARRVKSYERFWRWCRRNPVPAGLTVAVALSLLLGIIASGVCAIWALDNADRADQKAADAGHERDDARQQRDKADTANDKLRRTLYDADMNLVQAAWELNNTPRFLDLLRRQRPAEGQTDLRGFEYYYWQRLGHAEERSFRVATEGTVGYVSFSPDGKRVAVAFHQLANQAFDNFVKVYDTETGAELVTLRLGQSHSGAFSGDQQLCLNRGGTRLSMLRGFGTESELSTWDVGTVAQLSKIQYPELARHRSLSFSSDGERVVFTYATGKTREQPGPWMVTVRETATGKEVMSAAVPCYRLQFPAFSADGKRVAAVSSENTVHESSVLVWDVASGTELVNVHVGQCICAALSPDGMLLATGGGPAGSEAIVWDVATGKHVYGLPEPTGCAFHLMFSPDGKRLGVVGSTPPTAMVWEMNPANQATFPTAVLKIAGHNRQISWLGFSADSRRAHSADTGGTVKVWDAEPPGRVFDVKGEVKPTPLTHRVLSADASRLAVLDADGPKWDKAQIAVFDASGRRLSRFDQIAPGLVQFGPIRHALALSPEGRRIVTHGLTDGTTAALQVYDTATGERVLTIPQTEGFGDVGFSPDGTQLVAALPPPRPQAAQAGGAGPKPGFKIWNGATGKELHAVEITGLGGHAFSPDGKLIAWVVKPVANKQDCEVRVWDTTTGQEIDSMRKQFNEGVAQVAFSPDGRSCAVLLRRFAFMGKESEVKVWDAAGGDDQVTLLGDFQEFTFAPDGRRIATYGGPQNSERGEIKLWDTVTGRELLTLRTSGRRSQIVFSKDGNRLFAVKNFNNDPGDLVQVWDATPLMQQPQGSGGQ
jgi:serine/threonine protein kinase/WD40 repeat protein